VITLRLIQDQKKFPERECVAGMNEARPYHPLNSSAT
jgi:hypothetical protein